MCSHNDYICNVWNDCVVQSIVRRVSGIHNYKSPHDKHIFISDSPLLPGTSPDMPLHLKAGGNLGRMKTQSFQFSDENEGKLYRNMVQFEIQGEMIPWVHVFEECVAFVRLIIRQLESSFRFFCLEISNVFCDQSNSI